jgi:hypothetical protein
MPTPAVVGVAATGAVADFTEVATAAALWQSEAAAATAVALSQCAVAATVMPDTGIDVG